jgi:hypothetical protein
VSVHAQLAHELFGVTVEPAQNAHTWHPDVRFFSLKKDGQQKAFFYLDPYSRPAGAHAMLITALNLCVPPAVFPPRLASGPPHMWHLSAPCPHRGETFLLFLHESQENNVLVAVAEKRGGAWMDEVVGQSRLLAPPGQALRLPVAHMVWIISPASATANPLADARRLG